MLQGPPNPRLIQEKVQKGDFLKKPSRELKFFVVLGSYESFKDLERETRSSLFFGCLKSYTSSVSVYPTY